MAPWASQANQVQTITLPNCPAVNVQQHLRAGHSPGAQGEVPAGNEAGWTFTFNGPGTRPGRRDVDTTGAGYMNFTTSLEQGSYTITETSRPGSTSPAPRRVLLLVVYPDNADHNYQCTFTNTQRGSLEVTKTVTGTACPRTSRRRSPSASPARRIRRPRWATAAASTSVTPARS